MRLPQIIQTSQPQAIAEDLLTFSRMLAKQEATKMSHGMVYSCLLRLRKKESCNLSIKIFRTSIVRAAAACE